MKTWVIYEGEEEMKNESGKNDEQIEHSCSFFSNLETTVGTSLKLILLYTGTQ